MKVSPQLPIDSLWHFFCSYYIHFLAIILGMAKSGKCVAECHREYTFMIIIFAISLSIIEIVQNSLLFICSRRLLPWNDQLRL